MKSVAVIIGGSKGIGKSICEKYLKEGYIVINGSRSNPKINNKYFYSLKLDVKNEANIKSFFINVKKITKKIDVLINNAGMSEWKSIKNKKKDFIYNIFETNVFYIFWSCKYAIKLLGKNSSIINISSIAGKRGSKNNSAYSASKFAVNGITQSLAKELGQNKIKVNAICPVLIKTPGLIYALKQKDSPAYKSGINPFLNKFIKANSSNGKLPTANDVADFTYFLSSDSNQSITGQCINIDNGVFPQ